MSVPRNNSTHYADYSVNPMLIAEAAANLYKAMRAEFPDKKLLVAYRGYSGASLGGAILACAGQAGDNKIRGAFVRKTLEGTHSYSPVEHDEVFEPTQLVIIDDFICSGDTIQKIENAVNIAMGKTFKNLRTTTLPTVVMVVYYASCSYRFRTKHRIYSAALNNDDIQGWRNPELRAEVEPIPEPEEKKPVSVSTPVPSGIFIARMLADIFGHIDVEPAEEEILLPETFREREQMYGPGTFFGSDDVERRLDEAEQIFTDTVNRRLKG